MDLCQLECISNDPDGRVILAEEKTDYGSRFALKRFHRRNDGTAELLSFNPAHPAIQLKDGLYEVYGWFVGSVRHIDTIEKPHYRYVSEMD